MVTYGEEEWSHRAQDQHRQLGFRESPALRLVSGRPRAVTMASATGDLGEDVHCGHIEECPGGEEHGQTRGGDSVGTPGAGPGQENRNEKI